MVNFKKAILSFFSIVTIFYCQNKPTEMRSKTAEEILGNSKYLAISYGGYRHQDHSIEPTVEELKEDMKLLSAMGIKILRTYKVHLPHASNVLKAISELKKENPNFEMYVMLGAWIDCKNAWTDEEPIHNIESEANKPQMEKAVALANQYPDIVKVIAVGNEAMVKWAESYYVEPYIILKWVNYLQDLKKEGKLPKNLWVTSSDNFASWGGGGEEYHVEDLNKLIKAVDFLSVHTYPMHDTHYQPDFWLNPQGMEGKTDMEKIEISMLRAKEYAMMQYQNVKKYMQSLGVSKPIHIGETGWASMSSGFYGAEGSKACDEYKEALYYKHMRDWTNQTGMSCFYFEGFDEPWKGGDNTGNSEKHFGLFTVDGKAKYALWDMVDQGVFKGLIRNGNAITKTYNGDKTALMKDVLVPITAQEVSENQ
ncbi:MAG: glycosyl hydrolase family 17 [Flavobacteriales bacterium]|nr:glycosyl hydrolase family 17 [Flavobacteriia bacterium]NCP06207.1 glycosyl hydrolase family 17 [Flavobacteriales bacterium]NCP52257.1 glycosyl hydrolase family 17 [Flavobacteriales bacterium]NCP61109.1 glycosyl hydrolase family 17 [Flavobacteriales bacterium]NCP88736.1 glycosyl hydrolase family 17 [Flavobacteriales bacterium]